MNSIQTDTDTCFDKIPVIVRARDYRLYDKAGNRYIDFYRDAGRSLFGHRPKGLTTLLKNTLEKGLGAGLPSVYQNRLINQLAALFPGYKSFCLYASTAHALDAVSLFFRKKIILNDIHDPLTGKKIKDTAVSYWRPYSPENKETDILIPIIPFGYGASAVIVCSKKPMNTENSFCASPFVLTGLLHAISLLNKITLPAWIEQSIPRDSEFFERKGIYLKYKKEKKNYSTIFTQFLQEGVLLPPSHSIPGILPFELSAVDLNKINRLMNQKKP